MVRGNGKKRRDLRLPSTLDLKKAYKKSLLSTQGIYRRGVGVAERRPLLSFFALLGLLFLLIITGNFLRRPAPDPEKKVEPKKVNVYSIGTAPKMTMQAQVEKSGVISVVALAPGVVQRINTIEGASVTRGQTLVVLSSNYQGGNSMALARQLAEKQHQLTEESYPLSKDLVGKQRDLAKENLTNFEKLRDISSKSADDTQNLINLNNDIISSLDTTISSLESDQSTATGSALLATKQMKSQFLSGNVQLQAQLRSVKYQEDRDNPPTRLSELGKDIVIKQLDLQDKALDLNREISKLQLQAARVAESMMYPASPLNATVDRVFVRVGQMVNPGTPLVSLSGINNRSVQAIIYTSKEISERVSKLEETVFSVGSRIVRRVPSHVTSEAVQGNLYAVIYHFPEAAYDVTSDHGYISAQVPLGYADTGDALPFIPLDAIYQTQSDAYLFIAKDGRAQEKKVTLGQVFGRFVLVTEGISSGDTVILNRNVIASDTIEVN